jgi:phenylpyruvate tautomerase PptA (4-oxalocrotonate tautomerase family)
VAGVTPADHMSREGPVPLVRIDVVEGRRSPEKLRLLADTVPDLVLDVFAAPPGNRYQVITEHRPGQLLCQDTGLGIERSDDLVVLQVFRQERSDERKRALDAGLCRRVGEVTSLAPGDLAVSVVANIPADWSFGLGRAPSLEGDL